MQDTLRQGLVFFRARRFDEASECCRRLLGANPKLVEGHFLVGLIAVELKQTWTAVSAFGSVTKLQDDHAAAWAHLAKLFMSAGQPKRADSALAKAVKYHDGNPVVLDLIGTIHGLLGDQREASNWISQAVAKQPDTIPFLVNLANNQLFLGKIDDAEKALKKVLDMQPGNPNSHWILSNVRKAKDRVHVEQLEKLVEQEDRNPQALAFLNYGLGKELEDLEEWDAAFAALDRAAKARRKIISYDEDSEIEMYRAFGDTFTSEWLDAQTKGCDDASPIFVVGQPRTGTTLVERVITSHSDVHSAGELRQFGTCIRRLSNFEEPKRNSPKLAGLAADIDSEKLGKAYMATTKMFRGTLPRFVDKLPPNYLYIPLILKALPNARIVHLTRNPMDACFASYKQLFADAYPHSYDQAEMARHYARYFHLMALWRDRFPTRFFDIAYEDIARDLEPNARALIDYLQLPWEEACLHFHKQDAAVTTASAVQVRQPVHTRSIGRWRRYEKQLSVMRNTLEELAVPSGTD
jgi:tetratricopeptide (TPR) repeat protein